MILDALSDFFLTPASRLGKNIIPARDVLRGRKRSDRALFSDPRAAGILALVFGLTCVVQPSIAQTAKDLIDVPPRSRLLLRAIGSGDQVYGCVNGSWVLNAPDARPQSSCPALE
jgi:hypothetical protein